MKIIITGAGGLIGQALAHHLQAHELLLFTRHVEAPVFTSLRKRGAQILFWDAKSMPPDRRKIAGADVVIHLCGESLAGLWTPRKREAIVQSRLQSTRLLVQALKEAPPKLVIGASAIGYYGYDRPGEILTEASLPKPCFLSDLCQQWEEALQPLDRSRVIHLRLGPVIDPHGGMLARLIPLFRLGLGGRLGSGKQQMSWVSLADVLGIVQFCIDHDTLVGAVNATTYGWISNAEWTALLARALHRPAWLNVPKRVLRGLLGEVAEMGLGSLQVAPVKLTQANYSFIHPVLTESLIS